MLVVAQEDGINGPDPIRGECRFGRLLQNCMGQRIVALIVEYGIG
jgi:hypothetical protein